MENITSAITYVGGLILSGVTSWIAWIYKKHTTRLDSMETSTDNIKVEHRIINVEITSIKEDIAEIKEDLKKILFKL